MKKRTKYGLTITGIIAILMFMTMAITDMNKKSILEKDSHKSGKLVATKPEIKKAAEEIANEPVPQKDSDIFLVLSINPKFMIHVQNDIISEVYQLNNDAKIFTNKDFSGISLTEGLTKIQEILKENNYIKEDSVINISIYEYHNIDVVEATNVVASIMNSFVTSGLKVENSILKDEEINEIKNKIINYHEYNETPSKYESTTLTNVSNKYYKPTATKKPDKNPSTNDKPITDIVIDTPEIKEPEEKDEPAIDIEPPKEPETINKPNNPTPSYDTTKFHNLSLTELDNLFIENNKSIIFLGTKDNQSSFDILTTLNTLQTELGFTTNYLEIPVENFNDWRDNIKEFSQKINIETDIAGTRTKVGEYIYETGYTPVIVIIKNAQVVGCLLGNKTIDEVKTFINDYYFNDSGDSKEEEKNPIDPTKMHILSPTELLDLFNKENLEVVYIGSSTNKESTSYLSTINEVSEELNITPNYLELDIENTEIRTFLTKVAETNQVGDYILNNNYSPAVILIKNNTIVDAYLGSKTKEATKEIISKYLDELEPVTPPDPSYDTIKELESSELMNLFDSKEVQILFVGSRYSNIGSDMIPTLNKLHQELGIATNFLDMKTYSFHEWREEVKDFLDKVNVLVNVNGLRMTIGEYIYLGGFKSSIIIIKDGIVVDGFIGNKSYDDTKSLINKYISIAG